MNHSLNVQFGGFAGYRCVHLIKCKRYDTPKPQISFAFSYIQNWSDKIYLDNYYRMCLNVNGAKVQEMGDVL